MLPTRSRRRSISTSVEEMKRIEAYLTNKCRGRSSAAHGHRWADGRKGARSAPPSPGKMELVLFACRALGVPGIRAHPLLGASSRPARHSLVRVCEWSGGMEPRCRSWF